MMSQDFKYIQIHMIQVYKYVFISSQDVAVVVAEQISPRMSLLHLMRVNGVAH